MSSLSQRFLSSSHGCKKLARLFSTTSPNQATKNFRNIRSSKYRFGALDRDLSYEDSNPAYEIGVKKAWNSWNTTNLNGETGSSQVIFEDIFIRKFLEGTFPLFYEPKTPIIIRRRQNLIDISMMLSESHLFHSFREKGIPRVHFLVTYSEELLSRFLKCPVKLDVQCVELKKVLNETKF